MTRAIDRVPPKPKTKHADIYHAELVEWTQNGTTPDAKIQERIFSAYWNDDNIALMKALIALAQFYKG